MKLSLSIIALLLTAVAVRQVPVAEQPKPKAPAAVKKSASQADKADEPAARSSATSSVDEQAIRKLVDQIEDAFNRHDAAALAALFAENAEVVNVHGHQTRGQDNIHQIFSDLFEASPDSKLKIEIDSIRALTPSLMIEEGTSEITHTTDGPGEVSHYTVIHARDKDRWRMVYARDASAESGGVEPIQQLAWLIGDWLDEDPHAVVATNYRWSANQQAIEGTFQVKAPGYPEKTGEMRIAWDPQLRQLRSWIFDSEGGFATGDWSETEDGWVIKMTGVMHDGSITSATNILTRTGDDQLTYQSVDRTIGGHGLSDGEEIVIVRQPPAPEAVEKSATASDPE